MHISWLAEETFFASGAFHHLGLGRHVLAIAYTGPKPNGIMEEQLEIWCRSGQCC